MSVRPHRALFQSCPGEVDAPSVMQRTSDTSLRD